MKYLLIILSLCILSCDNDDSSEIEGCTDETATNYNAEATVDDDSCELGTQGDQGTQGTQSDILGCMVEDATNFNASATIDDGSCEYLFDACSIPINSIYLDGNSVFYNSSSDIAGIQFTVEFDDDCSVAGDDDCSVTGASGGAASDAGFTITSGNNIVLGFSMMQEVIPAGCGTLVELILDGEATGLSGLVFSDSDGTNLNFTYYDGP